MIPAPQQLVPYWNNTTQQYEGPGGLASGSIEAFTAEQATGVSATIPLGIATHAGQVIDVRFMAVTPLGGNDTYTVDVRKNGTTILTAVIAAANTDAAYASKVGALAASPENLAVGDVLTAVVTYTHSTGTAPADVLIQATCILN